jgi:hypothetical protein
MKFQSLHQDRAHAPIFIVGCARSGNTLLYHTLLSTGTFANYRGEPAVFDLIAPKFGSFASQQTRERIMDVWLQSRMFRISGLDRDAIREKIVCHCRSRGDFLRTVMDEIARSQGLSRWAVWGPDNLLCMREIKTEIPDALFLHIVRDGRDVTTSLAREGWIQPFPWERDQRLLAAALHWRWKVEYGRAAGRELGRDYMEVRYEDLILRRELTLDRVGSFTAQILDHKRIDQNQIGTLRTPNSTFHDEIVEHRFQPIERWRRHLSAKEIETIEIAIAPLLQELGYSLERPTCKASIQQRIAQVLYPKVSDTKRWLKFHTVFGRMTSLQRLHLED